MWGYPLWLFLGLWIVLIARARSIASAPWRASRRSGRIVFAGFAVAFVVDYACCRAIDHRYRAVFYPGDALGAEMSRRFRALTGRPLAYVIGACGTAAMSPTTRRSIRAC